MTITELADYLKDKLGDGNIDYQLAFGELTLATNSGHIETLLKFLRDDKSCAFTQLIDICGVDYPDRVLRFDVVYHLLSMTKSMRIRVKLQADEDMQVPSVIELFPTANWFEREAFDMYGIFFASHPDLRRLLTDYGFEGYPLRKDFPLTGTVELRYDEAQKKTVYEPVKLVQEFRDFDFESPWEAVGHALPGDEKASEEGAS